MAGPSSSSRSVESVRGQQLLFRVVHHWCEEGDHRCCELVLELHPAALRANRRRVLLSLAVLALASALLLPQFAGTTALYNLIPLLILGILMWHQMSLVTKESILIEMGVIGIQNSQMYIFGRQSSAIMHKKDIEDVIINEAITMNSVIFYLAVLRKDQSLKPLFQNLLPRLDCLEVMYQEIQNCLWQYLKKSC